jgi:SnoaL-like domain
MPLPQTLERFIARVESGAHVEAIEEFYTEDATMQENHSPPRVGRRALLESERQALARVVSVTSQCVHPVFVHGDHVVIRWVFEFTLPDGRMRRIEELAYQHWIGEKIAQEQFFYDPAETKPQAVADAGKPG